MSKGKISIANGSLDTAENGKSKEENHRNEHGLGWVVTGLFVVGDLAGGGIVALPTAVVQMNFWPGLVFNILMALAMGYTAYMLGVGWVILQRRWPEYREHCRKPYAEMGARAMGYTIKHIVSVCIAITQFGIAVVFLLLSAKNIGDFVNAFFDIEVSYCYVILIVAVCLLPVTFLKSPQDFWWAVVMAMVTTSCALTLIIIGAAMDYPICAPHQRTNEKFVLTNYLLGLGTILFSYGGHAAFPTILHDMRKPYHFTRSVILAFIIIFSLYMPVCCLGYLTYGNSLRSSIINSIQNTGLQQGANVLITLHCILTLTIVFNPMNQELEEIFNVPHHFCFQRAMVRTGMMLAVVFVAESVPSFGPLLDLVGSSTLTLTSLVFPSLFYLYLKARDEMPEEKGEKMPEDSTPSFIDVLVRTPKLRLFACLFVIGLSSLCIAAFGLIGGSAATYAAIRELATTQFKPPCYIQPFLELEKEVSVEGHLNCCGGWQNITRLGDVSECNAYKDFYSQI